MPAAEVDRASLHPLFAGHRRLRVVIDAVLEGVAGEARSSGGAARLDLGVYRFFGGDPETPGAASLVAAEGLPHPSELVPDGPAWTARIGGSISEREVPRGKMAVLVPCGNLSRHRGRTSSRLAGELIGGIRAKASESCRGGRRASVT